MKRFEFRLQRLLDLKKQLQHLAEMDVHRARQTVEMARRKCAEIEVALARFSSSVEERIGASLAMDLDVGSFEQVSRLLQARQQQGERLGQAQKSLETAIQHHTQLGTEIEILSTLREQHWQRHKTEQGRRSQDQMDSLGLRQWSHRPSDG